MRIPISINSLNPIPGSKGPGIQLVKKEFDKLVDGGASSPATATPTSFC